MRLLRATASHFFSRQFVIYLVVGGLSAAANFGSGAAVRLYSTSASVYGASVVTGMIVGTVLSFFLNRRYTFGVSDEPVGPQAVRFGIAASGAALLALVFAEGALALWQLAGSPWLTRASAEGWAHVAAIGLNTLYGFVAMKFFALKRSARAGAMP
jgi:putative flippase GtrA